MLRLCYVVFAMPTTLVSEHSMSRVACVESVPLSIARLAGGGLCNTRARQCA